MYAACIFIIRPYNQLVIAIITKDLYSAFLAETHQGSVFQLHR